MAEVASRSAPTRARGGSSRGGRGGSRGGGRFRDRQSNGDYSKDTADDGFTDQGELGEMKKQYSSQLSTLKELFPDWTEVDLLFALQETQGDLPSTVERISEGHVSQFADVKHHKERAKPTRTKDTAGSTSADTSSSKPSRGRGGIDSARGGGRGRADRGRGGSRGGRGGHGAASTDRTASNTASVPTPENGWSEIETTDSNAATGEGSASSGWQNVVSAKETPAAASEGAKPSLLPESAPAKKTWAQMFAHKPAPAPTAPEPVAAPPTNAAEDVADDPVEQPAAADTLPDSDETVPPSMPDEVSNADSFEMVEAPEINIDETPLEVPPSKDALTVDNVEHLPDVSQPPPTETAASTVDSSHGPGSATPSVLAQPIQQPPIGRPGLSGYATTALKAATPNQRSASFQRRILDQQESVVMPSSHSAVDRAALQFGSMGLNSEAEDVEEERENAETRTQPPQHSPTQQPRATLPPVSRTAPAATEPAAEAAPAIKPAPGLPPAPQQQPIQQSPSASSHAYMTQQGSQQQAYGGYGRYGQMGMPSEASAPGQKQSNDPFGQQQNQASAYDSYGTQNQQGHHGSHAGGYSSAANDYSSYYTADGRNAYQNYYASAYGSHGAAGQHEAASQQRSGSAYGAASAETGYGSSQSQQQNSNRYGETASGHNTPNPTTSGQQQQSGAQSQHSSMHQQSHGQNQHSAYPYGGGYGYNRGMDPYSNYYQMYGGYGQGGYGGAFGGKGNMYGGPHQGYGMSPSGYDQHSSSPATNAGSYGQSASHGRDSALSGGLTSDYGRSGSTQPSQSQQQSSNASSYGGMHDVFGRSGAGYGAQAQQYGQQATSTQGEDALKSFGGDATKGASSAAASSLNQPGRPGSATNNSSHGLGSSLPPPQSQQQHGFGGAAANNYPGGSQYGGGLGGLGGQGQQQSHQGAGGYGGYGSGFGNTYGSYGRGGWGGNYGH